MWLRKPALAVFTVASLAITVGVARQAPHSGATVHEWGTFTSVAGPEGLAVDWLPLGGPTDLPCFVKHIDPLNIIYKVAPGMPPMGPGLTYETARTRLWGKVRMETPVIYFYSPTAYDAQVNIDFPRGVITEFFPTPTNTTVPLNIVTLRDTTFVHSMQWNVRISPEIPELYPNGGGESHYYAARATDATPLRVGVETEKFIFYRGVASFPVPIQTRVLANGDVEISNLSRFGPLPMAILFESRNGRVGYRVAGPIGVATTVKPPELTSSIDAIRGALRKELVAAGLYPREAQAMLDTWRDSWFEEGARVFYLVPPAAINEILPLRINPAPASVARVFIGRMEIVNEATLKSVADALNSNDTATLERYGRFLNPISARITSADKATRDRMTATANAAFARYTSQLRVCE